jgi:hypothetical protein
LYPYTSDYINGFIQLNLSANSISKFRTKVDKGDIVGVNSITTFDSLSVINVVVGTTENYIYVNGDITLPNDIIFALDKLAAVEGNEFRIHFDCTSLNLNGKSLKIVQDYNTVGQTTIKEIKQGDIYQMLNQEKGIVITLKYTGGTWVAYQNYDLGRPNEVITLDGVINEMFDEATGLGIVRGLFGYVICDQVRVVNGVNIPNLKRKFLLGVDEGVINYNTGDTGGEETHILTVAEMPAHSHALPVEAGGTNIGDRQSITSNAGADEGYGDPTGLTGGGQAHNNMPPYYVVIYAKKAY